MTVAISTANSSGHSSLFEMVLTFFWMFFTRGTKRSKAVHWCSKEITSEAHSFSLSLFPLLNA